MISTDVNSQARRNASCLGRAWSRVTSAMQGWRERERCRRELEAFAVRRELGKVLADSGLAEWQLPAILDSDPERGELLNRMMQHFGIDRAKPVAGLRDLEWTCVGCRQTARCRAWLASRPTTGDYHAFCPNAEALDAIKGKP
jgi:hypothetical protein